MDDRKLEVLWISDLVAPTGFARVSHSIIKYLEDQVNVTGIGVNYNGDPHPYKFKVYPTMINGSDIYGIKRLEKISRIQKYDVIFILNDAWVIDEYLRAIKQIFKENLPEIVVYFPVDAEEHNSGWYSNFDIVSKAVTYTEFGKNVVLKCAPELKDKLVVLPHGVDQKVFYKLDREESRKRLFPGKFDEVQDSFIFLNANRNQPRKRLDVTMEGFALFSQNKPKNVRLYMHCGIVDSSVNISTLAVRFNIDDRVIVTSAIRGVQGVSEEKLNLIYNACNVGLNTSLGEGWGLTNIEHSITGAPQIVPNHSACAELYSDCGLLIPTIAPWRIDNILTKGYMVKAEDLAQHMETLYSRPDIYKSLSKKGIEKFSSDYYNWQNIAQQWLEIFKEVCSK